jgi:hypothetical protein
VEVPCAATAIFALEQFFTSRNEQFTTETGASR